MSTTPTLSSIDVYGELVARWERKVAAHDEWQESPDRWELPEQPTWAQILAREPRLASLEYEALRFGQQDRDSYIAWYRHLKPQIERLVGNIADDQPIPLQSSAVYDVVYQHLLHIYEEKAIAKAIAQDMSSRNASKKRSKGVPVDSAIKIKESPTPDDTGAYRASKSL